MARARCKGDLARSEALRLFPPTLKPRLKRQKAEFKGVQLLLKHQRLVLG